MCLGIPGRVVSISSAENKLGIVDVGGVRRETNLVCVVDPAEPIEKLVGEWVLVHVGFAMSRIDPEEAEKTLSLLRELGEAQEAIRAMQENPQVRDGRRSS